jgi:hypothetical protein
VIFTVFLFSMIDFVSIANEQLRQSTDLPLLTSLLIQSGDGWMQNAQLLLADRVVRRTLDQRAVYVRLCD